jgi:hypothetical protein
MHDPSAAANPMAVRLLCSMQASCGQKCESPPQPRKQVRRHVKHTYTIISLVFTGAWTLVFGSSTRASRTLPLAASRDFLGQHGASTGCNLSYVTYIFFRHAAWMACS